MPIPKSKIVCSLTKEREREREEKIICILICSNTIKTSRFKSGPSEYFRYQLTYSQKKDTEASKYPQVLLITEYEKEERSQGEAKKNTQQPIQQQHPVIAIIIPCSSHLISSNHQRKILAIILRSVLGVMDCFHPDLAALSRTAR